MPQLKPTRGIRLNRSHPFSRGLVGLWLFNEGSGGQVFDLSGNRYVGTLNGTAPSWTAGKFGPAVLLPGTNEYVGIADSPILSAISPLTVIAWVKTTSTKETGAVVVGKYATGNREWLVQSHLSVNNRLRLVIYDESANAYIARDYNNASHFYDGKYHQIGGVWDGGVTAASIKLYLDGLQVDNQDLVGGTFVNIEDLTANLRIGAISATSNQFDGEIDHVIIYNRALSASEIALLYREPFCMFEEAMRPKLIGGQIVNLAGSSVALSSLSATAKAMRKVGGNVVGTTDVTALLNSIRSFLDVESNWKREALFNGMTANAFRLGTTLSLGWFWVRVAGCSALYRGSSMGEIDFVNILAVSEQGAREISPPSYISHNSGSTYFYVVRRFNNCGYQECTLAASVKVSIESTGELAQPQPNKVFDSGAELVDGNKIKLVWYYCPIAQKSQPVCFNVYYDDRTEQIDYENPLATIGYKGRKFYSFQSSVLEAGKYLFAIRAEDTEGLENSSLVQLQIQIDSTSLDTMGILSAEAV